MKRLLSILLVLTLTPLCAAGKAKLVPQEILDRIEAEQPTTLLPRYMTRAERLLPPLKIETLRA